MGKEAPPMPVAPPGLRPLALPALAMVLAACAVVPTPVGGAPASASQSSSSTAPPTACGPGAAATDAGTVAVAEEPDAGVDTPNGKCWADIRPTPMAIVDSGSEVGGTSATFEVAWSPQALYIRAFAATWPLYDSGGRQWWKSDATEFGVSGTDDHAGRFVNGNQHNVGITPDGRLRPGVSGGLAPAGALAQVVDNQGFYTELIVPWAGLRVSRPAGGQQYQFDIGQDFVDDSGNRIEQLVWQGEVPNLGPPLWNQDTAQWGDILLR